MHSSEKRKQLENYFYNLKLKRPVIVFTVAFIIYYNINHDQLPGISLTALITTLLSFSLIIYRLVRYYNIPTDATVDSWLQIEIEHLIKKSYQKLGIERIEGMPDPLLICSPVYWNVRGISVEDLGLRKGKDNILRFSVYQITIFHMDEHVLASYICYYNFLSAVALNERTYEYHYKDVVSVTTQEVSSNYNLLDGQKLVHVQEFRLSVTSGESFCVTINPYKIAEMRQAQLPPTGAEKAVSVIRSMLRTKKT